VTLLPPYSSARERREILLEKHGGDVKALAEELRVHRSTAHDWLKQEAIDPANYRKLKP
jgi:transposase